MKSKPGKSLICIGLLFVAGALFLSLYNMRASSQAGTEAQNVAEELHQELQDTQSNTLYERYPDMEMPKKEVNGDSYIGVLQIPKLDLELPVQSEWSMDKLKSSICRYYGSAYRGDMIIAGHNYRTHFSKIVNLSRDTEIVFTDMAGNVFYYKVLDIEKIPGTDVKAMKTGTWNLTLFTCDYSGKNRIAVRCIEASVMK